MPKSEQPSEIEAPMSSAKPQRVTLEMTQFSQGIWQGQLTTSDPAASAPDLVVTQDGVLLPPPEMTALPGATRTWAVRWEMPSSALREGISVFLIVDSATDTVLARLPVLAGIDLADDLRGEVALLRAELDQLRGAFQDMMRPRDPAD